MKPISRTGVLGALALASLIAVPDARAQKIDLGKLGNEALKTVAVGAVVKANAGALNKFINSVTLRKGWKDTQSTKVVPILSIGDKGYVGAAQVSGPASSIKGVQAVWQAEGSKRIGDGIYRVKALIPSNSLSPLSIRRVQKVGVTALIDTATGGTSPDGPVSKGLRGGDLLKAGAIAVAVKASAKQIDAFVNAIGGNRPALSTRVVPVATLGERAYIGAAQLTGSTRTIGSAQAAFIYDDSFDRGRYRVRIIVPVSSTDPTRMRRVQGVGLSAIAEATIQRVPTGNKPKPKPRPSIRVGGKRVSVPANGAYRVINGKVVPINTRDGRFVPPGLAKKGGIPPGLAKKGGLPPGQAKKRGHDGRDDHDKKKGPEHRRGRDDD